MAKHQKPRLANDEGKLKTTGRRNRRQSRAPKQSIPEFDPADTEISSGPPTLAQRFYALPQELQDEIFAWLLVRPVKWDREHRADCPRRSSFPVRFGLATQQHSNMGRSLVDILTLPQPGVNTETAWEDLKNTTIPVDGESGLYETWRQLRKLPALSHLELDALMLTRPDVVRVLRQPALKNLRSIKIAQALPTNPKDYQQYIWSRLARREDVDDSDFVTDIARAITGNHYGWVRWTKNTYANKALAERKRYLKRFRPAPKRDESEKDENDD
ncbi:hypothetical protein SCUP515_13029 [Seiridium cupressi]